MPETASFERGSDTGIKCPAVLVLCLGIFAFQLSALDPGKTLTQYAHRIWVKKKGCFSRRFIQFFRLGTGFCGSERKTV
jgi:hypothetical protein